MEHLTLYQLTQDELALRDELLDNGGELTPELEQALAMNEAAISTKVDSISRIYRNLDDVADAAKKEISRLQALKKHAESGQARLKDTLAYAMNAAGLDKLESGLTRVSWRKSKAVEVTDFDALVNQYSQMLESATENLPSWLKISIDVNKTELAAAINAGEPIVGAEIVEHRNIQIK